jgi:hypothetical protein
MCSVRLSLHSRLTPTSISAQHVLAQTIPYVSPRLPDYFLNFKHLSTTKNLAFSAARTAVSIPLTVSPLHFVSLWCRFWLWLPFYSPVIGEGVTQPFSSSNSNYNSEADLDYQSKVLCTLTSTSPPTTFTHHLNCLWTAASSRLERKLVTQASAAAQALCILKRLISL